VGGRCSQGVLSAPVTAPRAVTRHERPAGESAEIEEVDRVTWSSLPVPPAQPVDPGLAASAAALLSALVREEPRPLGAGGAGAGATGDEPGIPAQRPAPGGPAVSAVVPAAWSPAVVPDAASPSAAPVDRPGLPAEPARRRGVFGRR
jgi:hypothetical protein